MADNGYLDELNAQQRDAATFEGRNLLVLAGAGTGKTRTIIARAKYLLGKGVHPSRLLILSFTRKSAREIVDRLQSSAAPDIDKLRGQTFHSWCMELIHCNPKVFDFGKFTVIDEEDRDSAFRLVCGRYFKKSNFIQPEELAEVYSYVVNARCNLSTAIGVRLFNGNVDEDTRAKILKKLPVYQEVIRKYLAFKAERRYLDYDDILQKVAVGLRRNPGAAAYIAAAYDHILVDEMQDTNPLQYQLLESFWSSCNLFCVGDDAQSIYGFRGADFKSIHNFARIVPDSCVKKLTVNYRSTQEILDLSNWLLAQSPLGYDKALTAHRGKGIRPALCHFSQEWDQARDIVMKIRDSIGVEGLNYRDNMVLSRSNWGLKAVETCLIEARIPYVIYGGTGLMASAHVRDVVSALRVVSNPRDELAWSRYLMLFPRIGEITSARIIDALLGLDSLDACIGALEANPAVDPAAALTLRAINDLRAEVSLAIEAAFNGLDRILGLKYKDDWARRRADLPLLQRIGAASDGLAAFIADYILDPSLETGMKEESEGEPDNVVLTTIHSAKGLEAANCYIINVSYSQYPSAKAVASGFDAIEEDRRCLYVAMTRAKDRLYVYRSNRAARVEDAGDQTLMYFLNGLPIGLYDFENVADPSRSWSRYTGSGITLADCDDFDFS